LGHDPDAAYIAKLTELSIEKVGKLLAVPEDPVSVDESDEICIQVQNLTTDTDASPEHKMWTSRMQELVRRQLEILDPRTKDIILLRFGFDGTERTLEEIGQLFGVTRERIRQIEVKALNRLNHPGYRKNLEGILT
jgi:RNA polymerase primary sigma factor